VEEVEEVVEPEQGQALVLAQEFPLVLGQALAPGQEREQALALPRVQVQGPAPGQVRVLELAREQAQSLARVQALVLGQERGQEQGRWDLWSYELGQPDWLVSGVSQQTSWADAYQSCQAERALDATELPGTSNFESPP